MRWWPCCGARSMSFRASAATSLRDLARERYQRWLSRRLPPARTITLEQRRLFIFPSRNGFLFMFTLLLMLLMAINYQNNLAYGLTFWLSMLFVVAIHFTHANLMKLVITGVRAESVYPGQHAEFLLRLSCQSSRSGHYSVRLLWPDCEALVDVPADGSVEVALHVKVGKRGWFKPPRLRIESLYPLGLLRCWSFAQLDLPALVWPQPVPSERPSSIDEEEGAQGFSDETGIDDLAGFRDYRLGDPPRLIDWRSHARAQPLQTKLFSAPVREDHWLNWSDFSSGTDEQKLSWLCWLALQYHGRGEDFGLRLPGAEIPLAGGDRQLELVLRAMALHESSGNAGE